ncbi:MAG: 50S ribosomal protein L17 [Bacteroidales bacterium]|nr:50S ribosomal protein L17 [Bacteroidales bacterium]
MRHGDKQNNLGRTTAHREAMLGNMASSLIKHKRISTTVAKAKALRKYVEPLITKAKDDSTHSRRMVFSYLSDKDAVTELFREVIQKVGDRPGGYTRILKTGTRLGDSAEMCIIELVDFNENMLAAKAETKTKTTRRSRKSTKTAGAAEEAPVAAEKKPAAKTAKKKAETAEKIEVKAKEEEIAEEPKDEVTSDEQAEEKA